MALIAEITQRLDPGDRFVDEVKMWVFEEEIDGKKLTEIINSQHVNVKYLPGAPLGDNVVACASLAVSAARAEGSQAAGGELHCAIAQSLTASRLLVCSPGSDR